MPALTTFNTSQLGVTATWTTLAASTTYTFENTERTVLLVTNAATTTVATDNEVTLITPSTVAGLAVADQTVTVNGAGTIKAIGRLPRAAFNLGGTVSFTVAGTDVATLKAMVIEP